MPAQPGYIGIDDSSVNSEGPPSKSSNALRIVGLVLALCGVGVVCIVIATGGALVDSSSSSSAVDEYVPLDDERPMYIQPALTVSQDALCNDGGKPNWHFRESLEGDHQNDWLFRFEGGSACFSNKTCWDRWDGSDHEFMVPAEGEVIYQDPEGGIFHGSPQINPDFHDYNAVHMHYCSSDSWMGTHSAGEGDNDSPFHYKGYYNMLGLFDELEAFPDYGFLEAETIFITGFSAGGLSSLNLAQEIHDKVQAIVPNADIYHLSDSGWFLSTLENVCEENMDCETYNNCPINTQMEWQTTFAGHQYNPDCAAFFGDDAWKCAFPEYSYPFLSDEVKDSTILLEAMYDQMNHDLHVGNDCVYNESLYWDEVRETLLASYTASGLRNYVTSSCTNHDHTCKQWYYDIILLDDISVAEHTATWLTEFAGTSDSYSALDDCIDGVDWDCNPTCPVHTLPNHVD